MRDLKEKAEDLPPRPDGPFCTAESSDEWRTYADALLARVESERAKVADLEAERDGERRAREHVEARCVELMRERDGMADEEAADAQPEEGTDDEA